MISFLLTKNNAILEFYVCFTVFSRVNNERRKYLMANKIRTSKSVATKASSQLRSKVTSSRTKSVAASALRNRSK